MSKNKQYSSYVDVLRYHADHQPDKTAYIFLKDGEKEEVIITYAELDLKAKAIAARLQKQCRFGDRVLLLYSPGLEFIPAFFACLYAGVLAVPVYPPSPANLDASMDKLMTIISDAKPSAALTTQDIATMVDFIKGDYPEVGKINWIASDRVENNISADFISQVIAKDTTAFLQYTSGSTGNPKGVMVSHGNIFYNEEMIKTCFEHTDQSIWAGWVPFFHDMGLLGSILHPLHMGIQCIIMSPMDFLKKPIRWLQAISRYKVTTSGGPNFGFDLCVRKIPNEALSDLDLSCWKAAFNGAEPIRAETIKNFYDKFKVCGFREESLQPCYGMAETTVFISSVGRLIKPTISYIDNSALERNKVVIKKPNEKNIHTIVGCGQTWLDQKICIVDPKSLTKSPENSIGEIWISGDNITQGYWNKAKETKDTFHAYIKDTGEGPFLRTGDLGFMVNKEVFITGRRKDLIIVRGRNFYPHDLEDKVWKTHPSLRQGCCVAIAIDVENEEKLLVIQEVKNQYLENLNFDDILDTIFQTILKHNEIAPHAVVLIKQGTIPKTSSGKVQRSQCRKNYLNGTLDTIALKVHETLDPDHTTDHYPHEFDSIESIEDWLALRVSRYASLDSEVIEFSSSVLDYGLDSKQIISLNGEVEEVFGSEVSATVFVNSPTISDIANHLADKFLSKNK